MKSGLCVRMRFRTGIDLQFNTINGNTSEISISVDAFHAIVTDLFWIKVAAVAFAAADAFPIVKNARTIQCLTPPF